MTKVGRQQHARLLAVVLLLVACSWVIPLSFDFDLMRLLTAKDSVSRMDGSKAGLASLAESGQQERENSGTDEVAEYFINPNKVGTKPFASAEAIKDHLLDRISWAEHNISSNTTTTPLSPLSNNDLLEDANATLWSRYAYAYVIGGCDPLHGGYKGFLYNILVSARLLKDRGSHVDIVAFFQMSKKSNATELPEDDTGPLEASGVKIRYIPKSELESFYDTVMNKFRILDLAEYRRVLLLDGDVMPIGNLDYLFRLSDGPNAILRENVVIIGFHAPANAGFFLLEPGEGRYKQVTDIIRRREISSRNISGHKFDLVLGWGHAIIPPDMWVSRSGNGTKWNFQFAHSDQGLLYYYVKYVRKSVSIIMMPEKVENWYALEDDKDIELQEIIRRPFDNFSKPIMTLKSSCMYYMCDFVHFTGRSKPWLRNPPKSLFRQAQSKNSPGYLWWTTLQQINDELQMNIEISSNYSLPMPQLGLWATFREMDDRVDHSSHEL